MHGLDNTGEEGLGHTMAVIGPPDQEQVFQLVEGGHHRNLETAEFSHEHLEKSQDQVLSAGTNLKVKLREAVCQKVRQLGFIAFEHGLGEAPMDMAAH